MARKGYQSLAFKNTILISVPTAISAIGIFVSSVSDPWKTVLYCISAFLFIILVVAVWGFSSLENKEIEESSAFKKGLEDKIDDLEKENEQYKILATHLEKCLAMKTYGMNSIAKSTEAWAKNINTFANEVITNGRVHEKIWDKSNLFDDVCLHCRNTIQKYCGKEDNTNVSVGYIAYRMDLQGEEWISMVAHSDPESTRPHSYGADEKLSESTYYYADLIKEKFPDIDVAVNNEEILRKFKRVSVNTDLSKYSQYIAIPIYCHQKKLIGILQIVTKHNYIIDEDRVKLRSFAEENIIPFANMILLIDKINKGLYLKAQQYERGNSDG